MLKREFYRFNEVERMIGVDAETMRQALMRTAVPAYLEIRSKKFFYATSGSNYPRSGSTEHSSWVLISPGTETDHAVYSLSGWFEVMPEQLKYAAQNETFSAGLHLWPCDLARVEADAEAPLGFADYFSKALAADGAANDFASPNIRELWFRLGDLERLKAGKQSGALSEKTMTTRERNNLLRIISALAGHAGIDVAEGVRVLYRLRPPLLVLGLMAPRRKQSERSCPRFGT